MRPASTWSGVRSWSLARVGGLVILAAACTPLDLEITLVAGRESLPAPSFEISEPGRGEPARWSELVALDLTDRCPPTGCPRVWQVELEGEPPGRFAWGSVPGAREIVPAEPLRPERRYQLLVSRRGLLGLEASGRLELRVDAQGIVHPVE